MKIERYISILVVLVVGLFLVNASWPEAAFALTQAPAVTTCVQANAPANTWCVPATSGAGVPGTFCTTQPSTVAQAPVRSARPLVRAVDTAFDVLGSIVAFPFELAQCVVGTCP